MSGGDEPMLLEDETAGGWGSRGSPEGGMPRGERLLEGEVSKREWAPLDGEADRRQRPRGSPVGELPGMRGLLSLGNETSKGGREVDNEAIRRRSLRGSPEARASGEERLLGDAMSERAWVP